MHNHKTFFILHNNSKNLSIEQNTGFQSGPGLLDTLSIHSKSIIKVYLAACHILVVTNSNISFLMDSILSLKSSQTLDITHPESHLCQINCLSLNEANVNRRLISSNCRNSPQSPRGKPNLFIKPSTSLFCATVPRNTTFNLWPPQHRWGCRIRWELTKCCSTNVHFHEILLIWFFSPRCWNIAPCHHGQ